jgi:hypothetical protein
VLEEGKGGVKGSNVDVFDEDDDVDEVEEVDDVDETGTVDDSAEDAFVDDDEGKLVELLLGTGGSGAED